MSKAEKTRQYIIEKTAPVFNRKGYAGTSLSDITEATQLTKGSIYGNFANKDEVALAAFDHNLGLVKNIIAREVSLHEGAKEKLIALITIYEQFGKHPFPEGGCPILNTATEADDTHPKLKKKVVDAIYAWKKMIMDIIQTGINSQEFKKDTDAEQCALAIIAIIEGGVMIGKVTGSSSYKSAIIKAAAMFVNTL